jgi:hypothetical protein
MEKLVIIKKLNLKKANVVSFNDAQTPTEEGGRLYFKQE